MEKSFSNCSDEKPLYLPGWNQLPKARIVGYNRLHQQVSGVTCYTLHTNIITGELVEGEMSTSEVFQHFYAKLVKTLPMNDAVFMHKLSSANLFPGDVKDLVESKPTSAKKAAYFLDHMIEPSVTTDVGSSFDDLIKVMEDSEHDGVKELAELIRCRLREQQRKDGNLNYCLRYM